MDSAADADVRGEIKADYPVCPVRVDELHEQFLR
jgi:hypothetical protein